MGDWKYSSRGSKILDEANRLKDKWVFFKVLGDFRTASPRILPDGSKKDNQVIADAYLFLLSEDVTLEKVTDFQNSSYKLIFPSELRSAFDLARNNMSAKDVFGEDKPKFSPDLKYAISSRLRDTLEEFSKVCCCIHSIIQLYYINLCR